jgi:hypothetical protein
VLVTTECHHMIVITNIHVNQPKALVTTKDHHTIIITNIRVNAVAERLLEEGVGVDVCLFSLCLSITDPS